MRLSRRRGGLSAGRAETSLQPRRRFGERGAHHALRQFRQKGKKVATLLAASADRSARRGDAVGWRWLFVIVGFFFGAVRRFTRRTNDIQLQQPAPTVKRRLLASRKSRGRSVRNDAAMLWSAKYSS